MSAVLDERPPTLRAGWYWTTMGEIAEVVGGGTPRTNDSTNFEGGDVPWITPADLSGYAEKYISHGARFITRKGLESSSARLLPAGTVLFTSRAPIGYVAIARNPVATNQGFKSFVLKDGVLPEYVYWWLKCSKQRAEALASGTTFLELSGASAKKLPIRIAPIDEQRRIVAEIEKQISRLDEAVANLKRVVTRLAAYRQRALDDAFASEPNAVLGQLISEGPQNGLYLPKGAYGSGTPIVRIDDYQTDWIRPVAELRRVRATPSQVSTWALQQGNVLVNRVNSMSHLGKCVVVPDVLAGALFESNMMRFRLVPGVRPRYVELYLGSRIGKRRLTANAKWAVNQASINQKDVQATEIPLPSLERQVQIVAELDRRLSIVREVEAEVDANLKRAQVLRRAVLTKAFAISTTISPRVTARHRDV
ncbi:MAG: restriction endonuclease subunit S [Betaproteobacteria bacterium]|nr:MAG: restriction endonuclease subunit S [Betaproteobacteria bacterium]